MAPGLSLARAKALLTELHMGFSSPGFQKKLDALHSAHPELEDLSDLAAHKQLALTVQREVLPRYAFEDNAAGVARMMKALRPFVAAGGDLAAQWEAIAEKLRIPAHKDAPGEVGSGVSGEEEILAAVAPPRDKADAGCAGKSLARDDIIAMLRELLAGFSSDDFHLKLQLLKEAQNEDVGSGYYLDGCEELALAVQRRVLPRYGFEASRRGAFSMSKECSKYFRDAEVLSLHAAIARELSEAVN